MRTGSLLVSSYTIIFSEPTIVVRLSLLGASHESSTWAIVPDANRRLMKATSGRLGMTQLRPIADTTTGLSSSQYRRIEKSCGPRSQKTSVSDWMKMAVAVEEIALRVLREYKPDYPIMTNLEYYTAAVLQGLGLPPSLFPSTFALARTAGWTAHCLEQAEADILIRPDVRYVGERERSLPGVAVH